MASRREEQSARRRQATRQRPDAIARPALRRATRDASGLRAAPRTDRPRRRQLAKATTLYRGVGAALAAGRSRAIAMRDSTL
jgi:hypothetical protein